MTQSFPPLLSFLQKLERHVALSASNRDALLALPYKLRQLNAGAHLFREGDHVASCCVIVSGFVSRHKIVADGARQILSVHMRGDGVDFQNAILERADHSIQALTRTEIAETPVKAVQELLAANPAVAAALWAETLVDASVHREWTANVGRRDARTRIAHLLCELGLREEAAGLSDRRTYQLPLTQEQLADAAGLTPVHVNRVLQGLRTDGILARDRGTVKIVDWDQLARIGDFRPAYLHNSVPA